MNAYAKLSLSDTFVHGWVNKYTNEREKQNLQAQDFEGIR